MNSKLLDPIMFSVGINIILFGERYPLAFLTLQIMSCQILVTGSTVKSYL